MVVDVGVAVAAVAVGPTNWIDSNALGVAHAEVRAQNVREANDKAFGVNVVFIGIGSFDVVMFSYRRGRSEVASNGYVL